MYACCCWVGSTHFCRLLVLCLKSWSAPASVCDARSFFTARHGRRCLCKDRTLARVRDYFSSYRLNNQAGYIMSYVSNSEGRISICLTLTFTPSKVKFRNTSTFAKTQDWTASYFWSSSSWKRCVQNVWGAVWQPLSIFDFGPFKRSSWRHDLWLSVWARLVSYFSR